MITGALQERLLVHETRLTNHTILSVAAFKRDVDIARAGPGTVRPLVHGNTRIVEGVKFSYGRNRIDDRRRGFCPAGLRLRRGVRTVRAQSEVQQSRRGSTK